MYTVYAADRRMEITLYITVARSNKIEGITKIDNVTWGIAPQEI